MKFKKNGQIDIEKIFEYKHETFISFNVNSLGVQKDISREQICLLAQCVHSSQRVIFFYRK